MHDTVIGALFAVAAALCFLLWNIYLQRSLERGASTVVTLVVLNLSYLVLFVPALLIIGFMGALPALLPAGVAWYCLAGVMSSMVGPFFTAHSTSRIGVSLTTSLRLMDPLFAFVIATLFLGERLSGQVGLGIALILSALLLLRVVNGRAEAARPDRVGIGYGVSASLAFTVGSVARKGGLGLVPSALFGALMEGVVGLVIALLGMNRQRWGELRGAFRRGALDLWLSGLASALGTLFMNLALQRVSVPVAVALRNTSPWFALALVPLLIGQRAKAGRYLWVSTALMTAGMLLIVLR